MIIILNDHQNGGAINYIQKQYHLMPKDVKPQLLISYNNILTNYYSKLGALQKS